MSMNAIVADCSWLFSFTKRARKLKSETELVSGGAATEHAATEVRVDDAVAETPQSANDDAIVGTRPTIWTLRCTGLKRPLSPEDLVDAVRRVSVRRRTKLQAQDTVYDLRTIRLLTAATSAAKARGWRGYSKWCRALPAPAQRR